MNSTHSPERPVTVHRHSLILSPNNAHMPPTQWPAPIYPPQPTERHKRCGYPRVLFICKRRMDGYTSHYGLMNGARLAANSLSTNPDRVYANASGTWAEIAGELAIETSHVTVVDGNGIDREVHAYRPTHVVVEALWVTPEKMAELCARYPRVVWVIRLHSKLPFLAYEGMAMQWVRGYLKLSIPGLYVAANSPELYEPLRLIVSASGVDGAAGRRVVYLPNLYHIERVHIPLSAHLAYLLFGRRTGMGAQPEVLNIGCFGAVRPLKNHLLQAAAAIEYCERRGIRCRFHINAGRTEQNGEPVVKNLRALFDLVRASHELVCHGWLPHSEFLQLVGAMDVNMQVSLTETFNIVAADSISRGVAVVGSPEIAWLPEGCKASPNTVSHVVETLTHVLANRVYLAAVAANNLYRYNGRARALWYRFLNVR